MLLAVGHIFFLFIGHGGVASLVPFFVYSSLIVDYGGVVWIGLGDYYLCP